MGHRPHTQIYRFLFSLALAAQVVFLSGTDLASQRKEDPSVPVTEGHFLEQGLKALQDNRLDDALRYLTAAEAGQPAKAEIRNFRGIVLVRLGRSREAADEYRKAIQFNPQLEDAYKNLGFLEWTEHQLENARAMLERAVELAPADSFAHYYLGRVQLDAGLYDSAFHELERSGIAWPADPQFLIEAAQGYRALGQQPKAQEIIGRLSTMQLTDTEVAVVARFLLSSGDNAKAIALLRRLSGRQKPACPRWAQMDLALSYLMEGNYQNAARESQMLINAPQFAGATQKEAAWLWSIVGIAEAHLGESSAAVRAFRQATKLDSQREEPWLNLTRELMEVNLEEAISAAQEALKSNPESYALHLRLGAAYLSLDRYSESESIFRQLIAAGDPLPTSYIGLAQVLLRTGRAAEAVSELADAERKLGPTFLISYFQGLALDRAGRPAEATTAFEEAIRLSPNSSEAHLGLGQSELKVGHTHEAIAELEKCLQLSANNSQAKRLLSQAYRRVGDTQASLRYSQESAENEPAPQNDLLSDFILPEWQGPEEDAEP